MGGKHTTTPKKPKAHLKIHKPKIIGKHTTTPKKPKVHLKIHKPKIIGKHTVAPKKVVKKPHKKVVVRIHGLKKVLKCKISKNMRCGPKFNNTICPFGWCSKWGWCGVSKLHKSTHQINFDAKPQCKKHKKKPVKKVVKKTVKKPIKKVVKKAKKAKKVVKKAKKAKKVVKKAKKVVKKAKKV